MNSTSRACSKSTDPSHVCTEAPDPTTTLCLWPWVDLQHASEKDDKAGELIFGLYSTVPTILSRDGNLSRFSQDLHAFRHYVQVHIAQRTVGLLKSGQMVFDMEEELKGLARAVGRADAWVQCQAGSSKTAFGFFKDEEDLGKLVSALGTHNRSLACYQSGAAPVPIPTLFGLFEVQKIGFEEKSKYGPTRLDAQWSPSTWGGWTLYQSMSMTVRWVNVGEGPTLAELHKTTCPPSHNSLSKSKLREYKEMSKKAWIQAANDATKSGLLGKEFNGHIDADHLDSVLREQHKDVFKPAQSTGTQSSEGEASGLHKDVSKPAQSTGTQSSGGKASVLDTVRGICYVLGGLRFSSPDALDEQQHALDEQQHCACTYSADGTLNCHPDRGGHIHVLAPETSREREENRERVKGPSKSPALMKRP